MDLVSVIETSKIYFGNDGLCAARAEEFRGGGEQADEKNDHVLHAVAG